MFLPYNQVHIIKKKKKHYMYKILIVQHLSYDIRMRLERNIFNLLHSRFLTVSKRNYPNVSVNQRWLENGKREGGEEINIYQKCIIFQNRFS